MKKIKNLYISVHWEASDYINDIKDNFIYSCAYKYLKWYKQWNTRNYYKLFDIEEIEEEEEENYLIEETGATGYSQWEWQDFTFYFDKEIEKDIEAIQEVKYFLENLKLYFTVTNFTFYWHIETKKTIKGKEYTHKEELENISITNDNARLNTGDENEFLQVNGINKDNMKDYNIIYNKDDIIWN